MTSLDHLPLCAWCEIELAISDQGYPADKCFGCTEMWLTQHVQAGCCDCRDELRATLGGGCDE